MHMVCLKLRLRRSEPQVLSPNNIHPLASYQDDCREKLRHHIENSSLHAASLEVIDIEAVISTAVIASAIKHRKHTETHPLSSLLLGLLISLGTRWRWC